MQRRIVNVLLVLCACLAAGALAALSVAARQAPLGPKTHWEPYKHKPTVPQPDQHLTDPAIIGAIDGMPMPSRSRSWRRIAACAGSS